MSVCGTLVKHWEVALLSEESFMFVVTGRIDRSHSSILSLSLSVRAPHNVNTYIQFLYMDFCINIII